MDQTLDRELTKDQVIIELLELLRQNQKKDIANNVFEMAAYIDGVEKKLDAVMEELADVKKQLHEMQEHKESKSLKVILSEAVNKLEKSCYFMKQELFEIKAEVKTKAQEIVTEVKQKGKEALNKVSEFFGIKEKLEHSKQNVQKSIADVNKTINKIDALGRGMGEAAMQISNTFRTFTEKEVVDNAKKKDRFSKTEAIKKPWQLKKNLLSSIELDLDSAIDKLDKLSMDVEIGKKKKHLENEGFHAEAYPKMAENTYQYGGEEFDALQKQNQVKIQDFTSPVVMSVKKDKGR